MAKGKSKRKRLTVDVKELNKILDEAVERPMSQADSKKVKAAIQAMADNLSSEHLNSEKSKKLFGMGRSPKSGASPESTEGKDREGSIFRVPEY